MSIALAGGIVLTILKVILVLLLVIILDQKLVILFHCHHSSFNLFSDLINYGP